MMDITRHILEARSLATGWGRKKVRRALKALAKRYPEAAVDWEEGDEEWGCIVSCNDAVAYVSARYPIALVKIDGETAPGGQPSLLPGVVVIGVRDFDDPCLSVDPSVLFELGQRPLSENVRYDRASVNDLWWATV